jgi:hypothetical protein
MRHYEIKGYIYPRGQPATKFETVVLAQDRASAERLVKAQYFAVSKIVISTVADRGSVKK